MKIGVPQEIKTHEYRVGLTPAAVRELAQAGHRVMVQQGAAVAIGFPDDTYRAAGAEIEADAGAVFGFADLIVKVKEPQPAEIARLRPGQVLFTYLHLAAGGLSFATISTLFFVPVVFSLMHRNDRVRKRRGGQRRQGDKGNDRGDGGKGADDEGKRDR